MIASSLIEVVLPGLVEPGEDEEEPVDGGSHQHEDSKPPVGLRSSN